ncbi:MAG TPA: SIS domain-containing protein [Ktedonobacterales bacterium]|jgi:D-sedoheptulose 7-phosphate isomerase|nr:SIS domain-containing protein [Ktedonobacterales bacterium]
MIREDARARARSPHAADTARSEPRYQGAVIGALIERRALMDAAFAQLETRADALAQAADCLLGALRLGHKALVAGNGGSAAEAQHFAAELVGRFRRERDAYAALALTTDTAILTAIANDYGYDDVFARQVCGLGCTGDVFIAFSTSGESVNIVRAAQACRTRGITVIAVTGDRPNALERVADITLRMPSLDTAAIQELHMATTHILCDIVESELVASGGSAHA